MNSTFYSVDQLPCTMNADELAGYLGISRAGAYTLMHSEGFPVIRIGKRMIVPKDKFLQWLEDQTSNPKEADPA